MGTRTPIAALIGRHAELDEIGQLLDAVAGGGFRLALLSGPAGIGKTAVWTSAIEAARSRTFSVVSARPAEVETGLAFAALGDLLGPLLELGLPPLPGPQQAALDAALLRSPGPSAPHPLGVSLATLQVLRSASVDGPLLVAIDDVPWVDEASARALAFAIRRLQDEPVGFLLARRASSPGEPLPPWLASAPPERLERLELGPLSVDETGSLLRQRLRLRLARPVLTRLHAISGGTPFYAIELGRDLQARSAGDVPDALAVPRSLDRLVGGRIAALAPAGDDVALVVAALAHATVPLLEEALDRERAHDGLADAEGSGVLERAGDVVRFVHPLLAAAAYGRARPDRRRRIHEILASVVREPEERARHLARTADGADSAIAQALEDGAAAALRRGASEVAAELAEDAARLTPADAIEERHRRHLIAADDLVVSGDMGRADEILTSVAADLPDGPLLAEVLTRRARIALYRMDLDLAGGLLRAALPLALDDPPRLVAVHSLLAGIGHLSWHGFREARVHMWEALRLARAGDDRSLELEMLGHAATWRFGLARPWRPLMDDADVLDVPVEAVPALEHPDLQFARLLAREGDAAEARRRITRLTDSARARGDWTSLPRLLVSAAGVELEAGDWARAEAIAEEAHPGLLQTGEGAFFLDLALIRLNLSVVRGDVDAARAAGTALVEEVRDLVQPLPRTGPLLALGHLELSLGNAEAALAWLDPVVAEPGLGRLLPVWRETAVALHSEALLGVGRVEEAKAQVDRLERRARRRGPSSALAEALRARGLVRSALGDGEAAIASAEEAVAILEGLAMPFRSARAWFALGEVRRRSRQRAAARTAFERAAEGFGALGARVWHERARSELSRVAGRRPAGSALTDTERRVAELAGAGHTNKEIADALFMSVHTVEAHLTRVFRTLGVQSRTELARADLDAPTAVANRQP